MANNRRGGILFLVINGKSYDCKGNFSVTPGGIEKEAIAGANSIPGWKGSERVPSIEGTIIDRGDLPLAELLAMDDGTVTLGFGNGRSAVLRNAWWSGPATIGTEEGEIAFKAEGRSLDLIESRV